MLTNPTHLATLCSLMLYASHQSKNTRNIWHLHSVKRELHAIFEWIWGPFKQHLYWTKGSDVLTVKPNFRSFSCNEEWMLTRVFLCFAWLQQHYYSSPLPRMHVTILKQKTLELETGQANRWVRTPFSMLLLLSWTARHNNYMWPWPVLFPPLVLSENMSFPKLI